jgi:type VI secretion system protein ImpL
VARAAHTVFLEAGSRLLDDQSRWSRLVRYLRPKRLAAAIGRGTQAPRVAVVCFPCDDFLKPGAGEGITAAARKLRGRLGEVSQELGIRLPVYVLFTRADRLPYFADYVRSMSQGEAQQALGTTLLVNIETGGAWAERESQRLNQAFGRMVHALSLRRLEVLSREAGDDVRAGAYEFPRELRKVSELAVQFLIEVARPSQLGVNPFLRGFYFTGVRPVIKTDTALEAPRLAGPAAMSAGATSVFDARLLQQAMAATPARATGRKVPEWVSCTACFARHPVDDVLKMTGGHARRFAAARVAGAAAAACLLLSLGFTVSLPGTTDC